MICGFGIRTEGTEPCLAPFCRMCNRCQFHCRCDNRDFRDEIDGGQDHPYLLHVPTPKYRVPLYDFLNRRATEMYSEGSGI